jgi:hypothetical protein
MPARPDRDLHRQRVRCRHLVCQQLVQAAGRRGQIEREGPSPTLDDQLRDDEQAWALLRRQLDRLRKRLES